MPSRVYYNSACPVCNAGIKNQRRLMEACDVKDIEWIDVHTHPEVISELGAPLEEVRERLHMKAASGQIKVGADAFLGLWSQTPKLKPLAALFGLPILKPSVRLAYNTFARLLYRWNRTKGHW